MEVFDTFLLPMGTFERLSCDPVRAAIEQRVSTVLKCAMPLSGREGFAFGRVEHLVLHDDRPAKPGTCQGRTNAHRSS